MTELDKAMADLQAQVDAAMEDATAVVKSHNPKVGYLASNILILDFSRANFPAAQEAMKAASGDIKAQINYYPNCNRIALTF